MNPALRKFHRKAAPWLVVPLLITLVTGIIYRVGKAWFGLSKESGNKVLDVHTGEWLGSIGSMAYVAITGLGLLAMIATGVALLRSSRSKIPLRLGHRIFAVVLMLPLAASAITGLAYKFGEEWFHISDQTSDLLMKIHEGGWLGKDFKPFYVLFIGLGLFVLIATGLRMTGLFQRKSAPRGNSPQ